MHTAYYLILYFSMILVAVSQLLLKIGADKTKKRKSVWINRWVLAGYGCLGISLILNIHGLRIVPLKHMAFIFPTVYIWVALFSRLIFKENFSGRMLVGSLLILIGSFSFSL